MTDDPHSRCRFANDARLDRHPDGSASIVWPCGLSVDITPPGVKSRWFVAELREMHEEARRVRAASMAEARAASQRTFRTRRMMREARNSALRETDHG